ncbi:L,D-transpeptidase family protein [Novosphingobium subterraneum]|uniref:L,D-transpeptidase family protein n=1 Tax=Novosphingobium subterraneum TaxID=48936 RepID=UPI003D01F9E5
MLRLTGCILKSIGLASFLLIAACRNESDTAWQDASRSAMTPPTATSRSLHEPRIFLTPQQARQLSSRDGWPAMVSSLLEVPAAMAYGEYRWQDVLHSSPGGSGAVMVRVDLDRQIISVFRGGEEIGTAVILHGVDEYPTPRGSFPVIAMMRDHVSATYDSAPMPFTLRLTDDGVSIHGSDVQAGLGTHGCIGIPSEFAKRLFAVIHVGDVVHIV